MNFEMNEQSDQPEPDQAALQEMTYSEAVRGVERLIGAIGDSNAVIDMLKSDPKLAAESGEKERTEQRVVSLEADLKNLVVNAIAARKNQRLQQYNATRHQER